MQPPVPFGLTDWVRSIVHLSAELGRINTHKSLLTEAATERGEFFYSDSGIPLPRPATAIAWASLCTLNPVQGFIHSVAPEEDFSLQHGPFVLPFLPKIFHGEEQNQSLYRASKAHKKDDDGGIKWGSVYIGWAKSGEITQQLPHGQHSAMEWTRRLGANVRSFRYSQSFIPPLYAEIGEGWQFGVYQNLPGIDTTLRDPFIELAKRGILETQHTRHLVFKGPAIRRLLFRFLNPEAAHKWAMAYSEAMKAAADPYQIVEDAESLAKEETAWRESRIKKADQMAKKATVPDEALANLIGSLE